MPSPALAFAAAARAAASCPWPPAHSKHIWHSWGWPTAVGQERIHQEGFIFCIPRDAVMGSGEKPRLWCPGQRLGGLCSGHGTLCLAAHAPLQRLPGPPAALGFLRELGPSQLRLLQAECFPSQSSSGSLVWFFVPHLQSTLPWTPLFSSVLSPVPLDFLSFR